MNYSSVPPGDSPMSDAYNLMVAAFYAEHGTPSDIESAEKIVRTITSCATDWEMITAYSSILASQFASFCDQAMPEANKDGVPYPRPSEKVRLSVEAEIQARVTC